jgi:hypothetical protein
MNVFQSDYETRLKEWFKLRQEVENLSLEEKAVRIDNFWQKRPLLNHYLHPVDIDNWPDPWQLIYENNYCIYAGALGIFYTLLLLGISDVDIIEAKDDNSEDVVLVLVDNAKYILNYWPDMVVNNCLSDFHDIKYLDTSKLKTKIG